MKAPIVMLAAAVGLGLAAPAFATDRMSTAPSGQQLLQTAKAGSIEVSSQDKVVKKKKKKKSTTSRSSWGG